MTERVHYNIVSNTSLIVVLNNSNWDKKNNRFLTLTILLFKRGGFLFKLFG